MAAQLDSLLRLMQVETMVGIAGRLGLYGVAAYVLYEVFCYLKNGLIPDIQDIAQKVGDRVEGIAVSIIEWVTDTVNSILAFIASFVGGGGSLVQAVQDGVKALGNMLTSAAQGLGGRTIGYLLMLVAIMFFLKLKQ
jgi:predicted PurR-regulated permease PerM